MKDKKLSNNQTINQISKWNLMLNNPQAEEQFLKEQNEKILKFNPYFTILTFLISLADTIFQIIIEPQLVKKTLSWLKLTTLLSYSVCAGSLLMTILVLSCKNIKIQKFINYSNYILLVSPFFISRFILLEIYKIQMDPWVSLILVEFFLRIGWLLIGLLNYVQILLLHILIIFSVTVSAPFVHETLDGNAFNLPYILILLFVILISYFYTKHKKIHFYNEYIINKQKNWFSSILENLNSGIFYIKNKNISYVNKIMFEKCMNNVDILKTIKHSEIVNNILNNERENNILIKNENNYSHDFNNKIMPNIDEFLKIAGNTEISEKILDVLLCDICEDPTGEINSINSNSKEKEKEIKNKSKVKDKYNSENSSSNSDSDCKQNSCDVNLKIIEQLNSNVNNTLNSKMQNFKFSNTFLKVSNPNLNNNLNKNEINSKFVKKKFSQCVDTAEIAKFNVLQKIDDEKNNFNKNILIVEPHESYKNNVEKSDGNNHNEQNLNNSKLKENKFSSKNYLDSLKNHFFNNSDLNNDKTNQGRQKITKIKKIILSSPTNYLVNKNNTVLSENIIINKYLDNFENFILLGYKELEIEKEENGKLQKDVLTFEIFGRFYMGHLNSNEPEENFEIIFNDISRAKIIEEKNAEFKFKSLFLAKIAHEFKNPLICITELVEQINDNLQDQKLLREKQKEKLNLLNLNLNNKNCNCRCHNKDDNFNINSKSEEELKYEINLLKNLPLIKSLSNYLLILVKDLDYFSKSQLSSSTIAGNNNNSNNNNTTKNESSDVYIQEILEFCSEISKGLLKKNNKENEIELVITKSKIVPKVIWTDDTKLKQILINLISNAIKFTTFGKIKVDVSKVEKEEMLKFTISDSGVGMSPEVKNNLFKPYKKAMGKNNKIGAGLGLTICSDLVKKLGGFLDYSSKLNEGTTFSICIPYLKPSHYLTDIISKRSTVNKILNNNDIYVNHIDATKSMRDKFNSKNYFNDEKIHDNASNYLRNKFKDNSGSSINSFSNTIRSIISKDTVNLGSYNLNIPVKQKEFVEQIVPKRTKSRFFSSNSCNLYVNKQFIFNNVNTVNNIHNNFDNSRNYKNKIISKNLNDYDNDNLFKNTTVTNFNSSINKIKILNKGENTNFRNYLNNWNNNGKNNSSFNEGANLINNASKTITNRKFMSNKNVNSYKFYNFKNSPKNINKLQPIDQLNELFECSPKYKKIEYLNFEKIKHINKNISDENNDFINLNNSYKCDSFDNLKNISDISNMHNNINKIIKSNSKSNLEHSPKNVNVFNFIIADDEPLARKSTIRNFKKAAEKLKKNINILESEDGIETLNLVYKSLVNGTKISGIITDQTMKFLKGSNCAEILKNLFEIKTGIPIYLVSAYEDKRMIPNFNYFEEVFIKPLEIKSAEKILLSIHL